MPAPAPVVFATPIPTDLLPPLPPFAVAASAEDETPFDEQVWDHAPDAGTLLDGDAIIEERSAWLAEAEAAAGDAASAAADGGEAPPFDENWAAVRDANIRPYVDWRTTPPVPLPVMITPPQRQMHGGGGGPPRPQGGPHGRPHGPNGSSGGGGGGGGRNRKRRRGRDRNNRPERSGGDRNRDRGPRLPGFYNPGGD